MYAVVCLFVTHGELVLDSGRVGGGVDEDGSHAPGVVHHLEAQQDVGARAVAKTDHRLHAQVVQHVDQILAHDL